MKNTAEKIKFISDYLFSYKNKIECLNKKGLFDAAKLFESFASEVAKLYFKLPKPFKNLNDLTPTFPYVDLVSDDKKIFIQVSTCQDVPNKISTTLNNIKNSKYELTKNIKEVYFFVLGNESIKNVKDIKIGNLIFKKSKNLITMDSILKRARDNQNFLEELYNLIKKDDELLIVNFKNFEDKAGEKGSRFNILMNINEYINKDYHIDVSDHVNEIKIEDNKFVLIKGEAGSGKSVLCKKTLENKKYVLCERAEKLCEVDSIDKI